MNRLSKITIGLGIYIVISASFMRQLRDFLAAAFGENTVRAAFFVLAFIVFASYILRLIYLRTSRFKIVLSLGILFLAYELISRQPYFAEKLHIIEYGLLGCLALKSYHETNLNTLRNIILSLAFVVFVSCLDEGFQKILPYRVFDMRDIATNAVSGLLGIALELIQTARLRLPNRIRFRI
jgi:hypothetical protein